MATCDMCGKSAMFGRQVSQIRSGLYCRANRKFSPNLQKVTVVVDGQKRRMTLCARCKRTLNRNRT